MIEFLTLDFEAFGIDMSDLSLKIIKLKKNRKIFDLVSFGEASIDAGVIKNGEIIKEAALIKIIKNALNKIKGEELKTPYMIASLPEEKAFFRMLKMPKMKREDLREAMYYEVENYIPLAVEDAYFDFQVISPKQNQQDHLDVLIAALPKQVVNPYVNCFKKVGLQPLALEIESSAICRALIKNNRSPESILLIDLGLSRTSFIVFYGNSLKSTYSIPTSSQEFSEAISKFLNVDIQRAEKLKVQHGIASSKKVVLKANKGSKEFKKKVIDDQKIFQALTPAITELSEQVKKYLNYYHSQAASKKLFLDGQKIQKIVLCGGGAYLKGLDQFLEAELNLPVETGDPFVNISENKILSIRQSLKYTTAIGLGIRGAQNIV